MDRATEIAILDTAFEPHGDGFLFYRNRRASGLPVSADERAAYLAMTGMFERRRWTQAILLRTPVAPPRNGAEASRRLRAAMPLSFIVLSLAFAALFFLLAWASEAAPWWRIIFGLATLFFGAGSMANIRARLRSKKSL